MSVDPGKPDSAPDLAAAAEGPLAPLPRLTRRQANVEARLRRLDPGAWLAWAGAPALGPAAEVLWRPSGLRRTGVVAQFVWPRLSTRVAVGLDAPLAHALVDALLGESRPAGERHLPVSPVEWGVLSFLAAEALRRLDAIEGPLGAWDLALDRVGPEPFDAEGLGRIVTLRWPARLGLPDASLRLWAPEPLLARWLAAPANPTPPRPPAPDLRRFGTLATTWRAEAGQVALPRGLKALRVGGVLPLSGSGLGGTGRELRGEVTLALRAADPPGAWLVPCRLIPGTAGARADVLGPCRYDPQPPEAPAMSSPTPEPPAAAATDLPVTLVVEIGRTNLTLARLADMKPGDVLELNRHTREPVELTSNGRLVARGELVQIDTELGVRILNVLL